MKKSLKFLLSMLGFVVLILAACTNDTGTDSEETPDSENGDTTEEVADTLTGTYSYHVGGYDWGAAVDTVIVDFDETLDELPSDAFIISETKQVTDWTDDTFPVVEQTVELPITETYFVDENNEKTEEPTNRVAYEIAVDPNTANPLLYTMQTGRNTWSDPYYLTFTIADGATLTANGTEITTLEIAQDPTDFTSDADTFAYDTFEATDGTLYDYAHYSPEEDSDTLFVWLHGGGEGKGADVVGTDPSVILLANKATVLATEDFQDVAGDMHILAPQSPTMWLDMAGDGTYTTDGTSAYEESLKEMIDNYKEEVGADKVILAGPSNGGYMTLRMAVLYPDDYDMLIPICHGYHNDWLTDAQLESIKDIPMFFIYADADETLAPEDYSVPVIERLRDMDADEIKVSSTEIVEDTSGEYTDEEGNPYVYNGHWSWIYFHNNESFDNDDNTAVFDWINEELD